MEQGPGKNTLVIGASDKPSRYSYIALQRLVAAGHPVMALGKHTGRVGKISIETSPNDEWKAIDTVTLYINPRHQQQYYNYLVEISPRRVIFNPGTENEELYQLLENNNIAVMEACTLVLLSLGKY